MPSLLPDTPAAFMPYPVSTLSPPIIPNDLSTFKTRGLSEVEREFQQKIAEMREAYDAVVEQFNWNQLIYKSEIHFEPVLGETYHLYRIRERYTLSMIAPHQWSQPHIGSFRLSVGRHWQLLALGKGVTSVNML